MRNGGSGMLKNVFVFSNHTHRLLFVSSHFYSLSSSLTSCASGRVRVSDDVLVESLSRIVGSSNVITDAHSAQPYNIDWKGVHGPGASSRNRSGNESGELGAKKEDERGSSFVVFPSSVEEVSAIMKRVVSECRVPVTPQGGNTGLVGGSVPFSAQELILNFSKMNKIHSVDEESSVVSCGAGSILQQLESHANKVGLCIPLDLAAKGSCQIGGNVSTNAGGIRLLRYGSLRENVLGLKAVLADGSVLHLDQRPVRKDNTGLSLKQLLIGSEGTLALITDVSLLCPPLLHSDSTVALLQCESFAQVITILLKARQSLSPFLTAFELIDGATLQVVQQQMQLKVPFDQLKHQQNLSHSDTQSLFYVLLETAAPTAGVQKEPTEQFLMQLLKHKVISDAIIASDVTQANHIWALRENATEALRRTGANYKFDVCLPLKYYYTLVDVIRSRWASEVKHVVAYGHVGDGNVHLNIVDFSFCPEKSEKITQDVYSLTTQMNGSISAEHGIGREKVKYLSSIHSPAALQHMKAIKRSFDPHNLLNPGKFYNF